MVHFILYLLHLCVHKVIKILEQDHLPNYDSTTYLLQEKLKRLIKYLNFKEIKNKTQKQTSQEDDEVLEATGKYCITELILKRVFSV